MAALASMAAAAAVLPAAEARPAKSQIRLGKSDQVYVVSTRGGARRLTHGKPGHYAPAWAPHGRRIAVVSNRVTELTRRGRVLRTFRTGAGWSGPISWSPDGHRLAFMDYGRPGDEGRGRLVTVAAGGGHRRVLPALGAGRPDWSPDGRTIYYVDGTRFAHGAAGDSHRSIWAIGSQGGKPRKVASDVYDYRGLSPDGRWVLFIRRDGGMWIARVDGRGERRLARDVFTARSGWAPGHLGVFVHGGSSGHGGRLGLISLHGKRRDFGHKITAQQIAWAPDGRRVAWLTSSFESLRTGVRVRSARADGTHVRTLASFRWDTESESMSWSPDGRTIALETYPHIGD
jgi:Tol biopolymer transport system component